MRCWISVLLTAAVLAMCQAAWGDTVQVEYLGSFKLGTAAGYYSDAMTILPNSYPREAGDAVAGPTLITVGNHTDGDNVVEWMIPALSKTAAGLQTAATVSPTVNGTQVVDVKAKYQTFDSLTAFNDKIWAQNGASLNNFSTQLVAFDAGINETWTSSSGGSSVVYGYGTTLPSSSTNGTHTGYGIAPKRDESNVLLTLRFVSGTNTNVVLRGTWDAGSESFLNQSKVFDFVGVNQLYNLEYINISGQWYYALAAQQTQIFTLLLFNAATTGSNATPDYTFTLSGDIAGGAGWYYSASQIRDLAWDDQNKILYALDASNSGGGKGGRVHAFSLCLPNYAPDAVTDLHVAGTDWYKIDLAWTAPTDHPPSPVDHYDLRMSTSPITDDASFEAATAIAAPAPAAAGTVQTFSVEGLSPNTTYHFALKSHDGTGLVSGLSNVPVSGTTGAMDVTAPAAITDLAAGTIKPIRATLSWTAPADDGANPTSGPARTYNIRYSNTPITDDATFDAATPVAGAPTPGPAGTSETFILSVSPDTTYYIAMKAADEVPNWSGLSNVASFTTPPTPTGPPPAVADLQAAGTHIRSVTLTWTAPTAPQYATLASYDVRYSTSLIDEGNWDAATQAIGEPVPSASGGSESFTVGSLDPDTIYYFAVKTLDESEPPLVSSISNITSGRTKPPIAPVTVHNPWLSNDRVADTHTLQTMAATFDKAYTPDGVVVPSPTDIQTRAINSYNNFKRRWYHWGQSPPESRDVVTQLNVFGWYLCGSQAAMNAAILEAMGLSPRVITIDSGGHTIYEVYYNNKWHCLDTMTTYYVYDRANPPQIASMADVKADKNLVLNAVAENRACPGFLLCGDTPGYFADGSNSWTVLGTPGSSATTKSMNMDLRLGEIFKRTSESWATQYYNNPTNTPPYHHEAANDYKDYVNLPYWEPYKLDGAGNAAIGITYSTTYRRWANGTYALAPDFTSAGYQASLVSGTNIATFNDDGLTPDLHTAATGSLASAVFNIATPFYITDLNIDGTFVRTSAGDINRIYVSSTSATGGFTRIWDNSATGTTQLTALNARSQVFGKYSIWVKIELQSTLNKADAGVSNLVITPAFEHNKGGMAYLDKGVNNVTLTFDNPGELQASHNLIHVVYKWKENNGSGWNVDRQFEGYAMASPATFGINVGGSKVPRTEYVLMEVVPAPYDPIAPNGITDLTVGSPSSTRVPLTWTAPADYDATGGPYSCIGYDLRYSTSPITDQASFDAATKALNVPAPKVPGSRESFSVKGLTPNTTYYFAIKAVDKGLNNSTLSNVEPPVTATTLAAERITTLAADTPGSARVPLSWTAIDDGSTGFMTSYDLRYSTSEVTDEASFNGATQVTGMPAPQMVGSTENFTVMYLDPSTTYYFAIKAVDAVGNRSLLSNVISATTIAAVAISDLATGTVEPSKAPLTWTAIDEGSTGTAASYDLRYSTTAVTDDVTFSAATAATGEPAPKAAGGAERFLLTGLTGNTTYWVAIRAIDAHGRPSPLSNIISFTTPGSGPIPQWVGNLKGQPSKTPSSVDLTWSAPADFGENNTGPFACAAYDLRYSTSTIDESSFAAATPVTGLSAPKAPGQAEAFTVTLPAGGQQYYFAIKAADDGTPVAVSEISNCAAAKSSRYGERVLQEGLNSYAGTRDAYYATGYRYDNTNLSITGFSGGDPSSPNIQRGIVRFDLAAVPADMVVQQVSFWFYTYDASYLRGSGGFYGIYPVGKSWDEAAVSWTVATSGVSWTTAGGDFDSVPDGTSPKQGVANTWYAFDCTSRVQSWLAGTGTNYGWVLKYTDESLSNQDRGYSSEGSNTALRPKLVLSDLPIRKTGDIDGDDAVNLADLKLLVASWNKTPAQRGYEPWADIDDDGQTNLADLKLLVANWNR